MAWLCERATTGLQYADFEFDQPEDYSINIYADFTEGKTPLVPPPYVSSATQVKKSTGTLPDVLTERVHHICNQRFKDLLESFEPGVHFFEPLLLKRKNGERIGDYYLWTVGQDIDCILTEGMDQFWKKQDDGSMRFSMYEADRAAWIRHKWPEDVEGVPLRISAPAVRGRYLWLGGMLGFHREPRIFMSDELYKAWKDGKFSALEFRCPVEEVDTPWDPQANMGPAYDRWLAREKMIEQHWPDQPQRKG